jgi:hypothetical protein
VPLEHRPPRHEDKIPRSLDQRMARAGHLTARTWRPRIHSRVSASRTASRADRIVGPQLAPLEQHAWAINRLAVPLLSKLLGDQPPAAGLSGSAGCSRAFTGDARAR